MYCRTKGQIPKRPVKDQSLTRPQNTSPKIGTRPADHAISTYNGQSVRLTNAAGNGSTTSDAIIINHATHYLDLAASILKGDFVHKFGYSARDEYGLDDLSPESWDAMVAEAATKGTDGDRIFRQLRYASTKHGCG